MLQRRKVMLFVLLVVASLFPMDLSRAATNPKEKILFLMGACTETADLYMMDTDGQNVHVVASSVLCSSNYDLSFDGKRIAYLHASGELRILELESGSEQTVYKKGAKASGIVLITWLPDGKHITMGTSYTPDNKSVSIRVDALELETKTISPLFSFVHFPDLTSATHTAITSLRWFPDGSHIKYQMVTISMGKAGYREEHTVHISEPDGSNDTIVDQYTVDSPLVGSELSLSPDMTRIIRETNQSNKLELFDTKGRRLQSIQVPAKPIDARGNEGFNWTPDSKAIFTVQIVNQAAASVKDARGHFVLRLFDLASKKWTNLVAEGSTGVAPNCGFGACIRKVRWYSPVQ